MGKIIDKTYELLDVMDNSDLIKNLTKYKQKLMHNPKILRDIENIKKETSTSLIIAKRKELFNNNDYKMYMKYYNELSLLVFKINQKYNSYLYETGSCHHD